MKTFSMLRTGSVNRLFALVVAVSALALAPRIASASCGDWLQHPPATESQPPHTAEAPVGPVGSGEDELASLPADDPAAPPCGCEGPACRPAPAGPMTPAAPDSLVKADPQPAWLLAGRSGLDLRGSSRAREQRVSLDKGFAPGIYRPPRF